MSVRILTLTAGTLLLTPPAFGDGTAAPGAGDMRMRVSAYAADEIYRLKGYVGYQIDLQFEPGESFVGLGAGDLESLSFAAQDNHLFLKPRATEVDTNLTVLTTRRTYQFDYCASTQRPDPEQGDVIVHRVGRQFIVRRGRLSGCIVNQDFTGAGERLESGTVTPAVERVTRGARP